MNSEETKTENFIKNLRHVALTSTEAQSMRERLVAYSDLHAISESAETVSTRAVRSTFSISSFSFLYAYPRVIGAAALVFVLLISGTGVSYAAENTLPGQILYPVKVSIVEPIQGALITNVAQQAEWQDQLADRRLTEASTLAAENKLATSTQEYLEQATAQHVALAQQDATDLADSGNEDAALSVRSDLEARLSAHADFLALIAPKLAADDDATTTNAVIALLQGVEQDRTQAEIAREATEAKLASTTIAANITVQTSSATFAPEGSDQNVTVQTDVVTPGPTTPAQQKTIAFIGQENNDRQSEENSILRKSSALFRLLPGMTAPTTTASTTMWFVASSTDASSTATTTHFRILIKQQGNVVAPSETISAPKP
jgi:Domain of unknown function (DUF5667)